MTVEAVPTTHPNGTAAERDESKLARIRAELPALAQAGYFNAGTNGPIPKVAYQAMLDAATHELNAGRIVPGVYESGWTRNAGAREVLGSIIGCSADELALTHSTSEGMSAVLAGIDWSRGDEIVTTSLEHPCLTSPLALLAHRYGVVIRVAHIGNGDGDVLGEIAKHVNGKTRLIAMSHLAWSSGAVLPLKEIAAYARERGVITLIDAAQSTGQIPIDVHDLGVDAYAMPGQKWLCGPEATGALFVRLDRLPDIKPTYLRFAQHSLDGYILPMNKVPRFEIGEFYGPAVLAFKASLEFLRDEVGLDWAYARIAALARHLRDGLSTIPGVTVVTPASKAAGLVNFNLAGMEPKAVSEALYAEGHTIRYVVFPPGPSSARVSCGWWNTEGEIDRLVQAIGDLASRPRDGEANG